MFKNKNLENKNRTTSILGTALMEIESFQVYGSGGTKKSFGGFQDKKFSKVSGEAPGTKNKKLKNKKSDNIYFGNNVSGNKIFPSLRFFRCKNL